MDPATLLALAEAGEKMARGWGEGAGSGQGFEGFLSGAPGFVGGYFGATTARKRARENRKLVFRGIKKLGNIGRAGLGAETAQATKAGEKLVGGYNTAIAETGRAQRGTLQQARDQAQKLQAKQQSDAIARGFSASSVLSSAQRGLGASTSRALAGIQADFQRMLADLAIGKGQAEYQSGMDLASLTERRTGLESFIQEKNLAARMATR